MTTLRLLRFAILVVVPILPPIHVEAVAAEPVGGPTRRALLRCLGAAVGGVPFVQSRAPVAAETSDPVVTHRVQLKCRVAATQASVQGREELPAIDGQLELGLFGRAAPRVVENFLSFCVPPEVENEEGDLVRQPSLLSAVFWNMEPGVFVEAGKLRGLNEITVAGRPALEYAGRVYQVPDLSSDESGLSHSSRGLLTRRFDMTGPDFAITLAEAQQLDGSGVVFGRLLSGDDFLDVIEHIPVYSYNAAEDSGPLADAFFQAQKKAFTDTARAIKDPRFSDLRGRLLRRVKIEDFSVIEVGR